jgi:hypothetical protein
MEEMEETASKPHSPNETLRIHFTIQYIRQEQARNSRAILGISHTIHATRDHRKKRNSLPTACDLPVGMSTPYDGSRMWLRGVERWSLRFVSGPGLSKPPSPEHLRRSAIIERLRIVENPPSEDLDLLN